LLPSPELTSGANHLLLTCLTVTYFTYLSTPTRLKTTFANEPSSFLPLAPTHTPPGTNTTNSLKSFVSAQVSFSFPWTHAAQYDQGGLVLSFHPKSGSPPASQSTAPPPKWIKTGVEFYNSAPRVSTVACDAWADWSVGDRSPDGSEEEGKLWTTVSIEKAIDQHGPSLWVFRVLADGTKVPLREVTWVYAGGDEQVANWDLRVEAFAARPDTTVTSDLEVEFKDFKVEWAN
jgi:hypothetical protein